MNTRPAVTVPVRAERTYDVVVGSGLRNHIVPLIGEQARRVLLMHAAPLTVEAAEIAEGLRDVGLEVLPFLVPDGEAAKTAQVLTHCWSLLGQSAFGREDVVIGLGGGATTDLAGFVAASWLRGVRVLQIPTTLLGMVDAAVGGKTGINTPEGKNLVGAFHSPIGVLCDLSNLQTLPQQDLLAGMAEVVKCGFIADTTILDIVQTDPRSAVGPDSADLAELVRRAVQVKADVVSADLKESHLREILNYGHTFGHAIEHSEQFRWRHGDAVSVGMVFAAELAQRSGMLTAQDVARHREILGLLGLPVSYRADRWPQLYEAMRRDKKTRGDTLRFVVLDGIGNPVRLEGPDPALLVAAYAAVSAQ